MVPREGIRNSTRSPSVEEWRIRSASSAVYLFSHGRGHRLNRWRHRRQGQHPGTVGIKEVDWTATQRPGLRRLPGRIRVAYYGPGDEEARFLCRFSGPQA